jgi:lipid II isoglutaminyl synthase (glutamine-hydrolysing)
MFQSTVVYFYLLLGRLLSFVSKVLKKGSGTSITGLFVERWNPGVIRFFNGRYKNIIYISGTNGKTTTRAILISIFEKNGYKVASNRGGANILRGIAATMLMDLDWTLKVKSDVLILEVEEATLPKIKNYIHPDYLVLTNLFRDQLDAYGEIDKTLEYFAEFIKAQDGKSDLKVLLNGDDGKLVYMVNEMLSESKANFIYCGVDTKETSSTFNYETKLVHPVELDYLASGLEYREGLLFFDIFGNKITDQFENNPENTFETKLPGVYNVYNLLFAIAVSKECSINKITVNSIIAEVEPVFGRGEIFTISQNNSKIFLFLVKNPAGFDLVLDHVAKAFTRSKINLVFLVNDRIADSKDVSWLWDVNFEKARLNFQENKLEINSISTGGSRDMDMLLRLEYSGFPVCIEDGKGLIAGIISKIVENSESSPTVVFATYTAMLEFRKRLSEYTYVPSITSD